MTDTNTGWKLVPLVPTSEVNDALFLFGQNLRQSMNMPR